MARDYAKFGAFFFCFFLFCTCGNLCACVGIERCNTPEMLALEAEVKRRYGEKSSRLHFGSCKAFISVARMIA